MFSIFKRSAVIFWQFFSETERYPVILASAVIKFKLENCQIDSYRRLNNDSETLNLIWVDKKYQ